MDDNDHLQHDCYTGRQEQQQQQQHQLQTAAVISSDKFPKQILTNKLYFVFVVCIYTYTT